MTELSAVFKSLGMFKADRECGLVHVVTISKRHLVCACAWVDVWAVLLVREITAIIIPITVVFIWHTSSAGALELVSGAGATDLISSISTVVVSIAHILHGNTFSVGALEVNGWITDAVRLIRIIATIVVTVALPFIGDTLTVVTAHLVSCTRLFGAAGLISSITTVIVTITFVDGGDTVSVTALEFVYPGTSSGTVSLVKTVDTVSLTVTLPAYVDTSIWAGELSSWAGIWTSGSTN